MLAQGLGSFVVWILYGIVQARRSQSIRASVGRLNRLQRGLFGAGLMVGGILLLFGGFVGLQAIGALGHEAMTTLGWILATLVGLAFVHCQTMGMAMLVSLALDGVTPEIRQTSTSSGPIREP